MTEFAIKVENLSKCYRIGLKEKISDSLGGSIISWFKAPLSNLKNLRSLTRFEADLENSSDVIWALKDVSFEVKHGEVIGIIGANGAGKSTLLKIISRIVEPTAGRILLNGRVASLLEVGTGFHPELTGRENVYLNGTILGMSKAEVDRKFDEIVDFSGVEKFLDTPVKRYSSGMRVRLAFAVAAHLDPEILLIDEVLSVGDAAFQKKCLGKMGEVSKQGRTVLFVSHNMAAVQNLCRRAIVLFSGKLDLDSSTEQSILHYLQSSSQEIVPSSGLAKYRSANYQPIIRDIRLIDQYGRSTVTFQAGQAMTIEIDYLFPGPFKSPSFGIIFENTEGQRIFFLQTQLQYGDIEYISQIGTAKCYVPSLPLVPGVYYLTLGFSASNEQIDRLESAMTFQVIESDFYGTGKIPSKNQGIILVKAHWTFTS